MVLYKDGFEVNLTNENFIEGYKSNGWTEKPSVAPQKEAVVEVKAEAKAEAKTEEPKVEKAAPKKAPAKKSTKKK